jgi:hypothetical protein
MKKLLLILALMFSTAVYAGSATSVDVSGLSEEQIAELKKTVIDAKLHKESPVNISAAVRQEAGAWGDMGANMGKAMVGAAKEMGVAANDFSQTSLGKVTVAIVVYKIIGRDILKMISGFLVLLGGSVLTTYLLRTKSFGDATYENKPALFGLYNRRYLLTYETNNDQTALKMIALVVVIGGSLLVGLNCIL